VENRRHNYLNFTRVPYELTQSGCLAVGGSGLHRNGLCLSRTHTHALSLSHSLSLTLPAVGSWWRRAVTPWACGCWAKLEQLTAF